MLVIDADTARSAFVVRFGEPRSDKNFLEPTGEAGLDVFTPERKSQRLLTQQGYFTLATRPLATHDELLQASGAVLRRLVIPGSQKHSVLHHLRTMNIGAQTLFSGFDGLGRSAGELLRGIGW